MTSKLALSVVAFLPLSIPLLAHHNFAAAYDASAMVTVTGVVTNVEWVNPHVRIYLDVKDDGGKAVNWGMEGYPPISLMRTGFSRDLVKVGDTITLTGYRARASSIRAAGRELTISSGAKYNFGPAAPGPGANQWSFVAPLW